MLAFSVGILAILSNFPMVDANMSDSSKLQAQLTPYPCATNSSPTKPSAT